MSDITTRAGKGSPLTNAEVDANFDNLNSDKYESGDTPSFAGLTTTADINFGDNDKAVFGAGSDLQIYHDGSNSYVKDVGTGNLLVQGSSQVNIGGANGTIGVQFVEGANVTLRHNNVSKLITTSTGINVNGTATMDGLTVDGNFTTTLTGNDISFERAGASYIRQTGGGTLFLSTNDGVSDKVRLEIQKDGDISFYEDTGTTAKFFWDASAERLKLGTLEGAAGGSLALKTDASGYGLAIEENSGTERWSLGVDVDGDLGFYNSTDTTATVTFDDSGNVGIGTSSPAQDLHIASSGSPRIRIEDTDTVKSAASGLMEYYGTDGRAAYMGVDGGAFVTDLESGSRIAWRISGSERMRIDSSGNLLVGKTTNNSSVKGAHIQPNGTGFFTRDGGLAVNFNRLTSDGTLIQLQKDTAVVGSIGTAVGNAYFAGTSTGITFGSANLYPTNSSGTKTDAALDLGSVSQRFKNLHLSGGVKWANYTFVEEGGYLYVYNGSTKIMRVDSSGNAAFAGDVEANATL